MKKLLLVLVVIGCHKKPAKPDSLELTSAVEPPGMGGVTWGMSEAEARDVNPALTLDTLGDVHLLKRPLANGNSLSLLIIEGKVKGVYVDMPKEDCLEQATRVWGKPGSKPSIIDDKPQPYWVGSTGWSAQLDRDAISCTLRFKRG